MVKYTLEKYHGDASKVFVLGGSSGAMMTNVLAGSYPDVFEAGAAFSGTPHACFAGAPSATPMSPNQTCAQGQLPHSAQEWGNFVRNSYPGYTGRRTRMQIFQARGHARSSGMRDPGVDAVGGRAGRDLGEECYRSPFGCVYPRDLWGRDEAPGILRDGSRAYCASERAADAEVLWAD